MWALTRGVLLYCVQLILWFPQAHLDLECAPDLDPADHAQGQYDEFGTIAGSELTELQKVYPFEAAGTLERLNKE